MRTRMEFQVEKREQDRHKTEPLEGETVSGEVMEEQGIPEAETQIIVVEGEVVELPEEKASRRISPLWLIIVALLTFISMLVALVFLLPVFLARATITLVPQSRLVASHLTLTLNQTEPMAPVTLTLSQTGSTTGKGHVNAAQAHGMVTLYNASPSSQTISAGTLLVGADGVQIVTDATVTIPGANPPVEGQISVSAHSVAYGRSGNIAAYDINAECCKYNVFVKNMAAFTGGTDARDYPMVNQGDIDRTIQTLKSKIETQVVLSFTHQLKRDTSLLLPLSCTSQQRTDKKAGDEAKSVTVSLSETCTTLAYSHKEFDQTLVSAVKKDASGRTDKNVVFDRVMQLSVESIHVVNGKAQIQANVSSRFVYRFTQTDLDVMAGLVAGKTKAEAIHTLLAFPGVERVGISISANAANLPKNSQQIAIVVQ